MSPCVIDNLSITSKVTILRIQPGKARELRKIEERNFRLSFGKKEKKLEIEAEVPRESTLEVHRLLSSEVQRILKAEKDSE